MTAASAPVGESVSQTATATGEGPMAGLRWPRTGAGSIRAVLSAAIGAVGAHVSSAGRTSEHDRAELGVPTARTACVVMVDGLGSRQLAERGGHAPFLRGRLADARHVTSGFPSTTATSLTMLGTGEHAGRTGMLGYTVRDPGTGGLLNLLSWQQSRLQPRQWQSVPTLAEQCAALPDAPWLVSVGPRRFASSGLTEAALRGPRYLPAESLADRVDASLRALRRPGTGVVYLYCGDVDATGHRHGWRSWQWGDVLGEVDHEIGRLARSLPRDSVMIVTADHGMVDVPEAPRLDVAQTPELRAGVDLVAGEPRAMHLHTGSPEAVAGRWRDVLGDRAWVATREQVERSGVLGDVEARHRPVVGDVVVAMTGREVVVDSRVHSPEAIALVGVHGSLTEDELTVPVVSVTG